MTDISETPDLVESDRLGIGVIGAGRVGAVLGNALRAAGHVIVGVTASSARNRERVELMLPGVPIVSPRDVVERAQLVLLTVPDDAIARVVDELGGAWQTGQLVIHCSGALGLEVLEPVKRAGGIGLAIHPAMTFSGTSLDLRHLRAAPFAVSAPPGLAPVAQAIVMELGGVPLDIPARARPAYHAALCHGSNHLVVLVDESRRILRESGIADTEALLRPLLTASLDAALRDGGLALTGPASRGDGGTIARHLRALAELTGLSEQVSRSYRELTRSAVEIARSAGRLNAEKAREVLAVLENQDEENEQ